MYDYEAEDDTNISIAEGNVVVVTDTTDADWWQGYNEGTPSNEGFFPASFVELIEASATALHNSLPLIALRRPGHSLLLKLKWLLLMLSLLHCNDARNDSTSLPLTEANDLVCLESSSPVLSPNTQLKMDSPSPAAVVGKTSTTSSYIADDTDVTSSSPMSLVDQAKAARLPNKPRPKSSKARAEAEAAEKARIAAEKAAGTTPREGEAAREDELAAQAARELQSMGNAVNVSVGAGIIHLANRKTATLIYLKVILLLSLTPPMMTGGTGTLKALALKNKAIFLSPLSS